MDQPQMEKVFIALCQWATGRNREEALTLINEFLGQVEAAKPAPPSEVTT
jgi:hypothetical protein